MASGISKELLSPIFQETVKQMPTKSFKRDGPKKCLLIPNCLSTVKPPKNISEHERTQNIIPISTFCKNY